jgi:glycosyltransferase involved in cell wall biosynthesis
MSCKKPVIASPVGINTSLVEDGVNGYLAEKPEEWFQAFETLYRDNELRMKMSEANYAKILDEYNHAINCEEYIRLIRETVGK